MKYERRQTKTKMETESKTTIDLAVSMIIWLMMRQDDQQKGPVIGRLVQFYCTSLCVCVCVSVCVLVLCNTSWPTLSSFSGLLTVLGISLSAAWSIDSIVSLSSSFIHRIRFAFALINILLFSAYSLLALRIVKLVLLADFH